MAWNVYGTCQARFSIHVSPIIFFEKVFSVSAKAEVVGSCADAHLNFSGSQDIPKDGLAKGRLVVPSIDDLLAQRQIFSEEHYENDALLVTIPRECYVGRYRPGYNGGPIAADQEDVKHFRIEPSNAGTANPVGNQAAR